MTPITKAQYSNGRLVLKLLKCQERALDKEESVLYKKKKNEVPKET